MYIAHLRQSDNRIQTVKEHLIGVKQFAEQFGEKIGVKHIAGLAGMLHDMGKYTNEFKNYILEAANNPSSPPKRGSVDHSTAGGKLLFQLFHNKNNILYSILAEIVGNAIISHHSYLHDYLNPQLESDYLRRVQEKEISEYSLAKERFFQDVISEEDFHEYINEAAKELRSFLAKESSLNIETRLMFLTKFIFSVLIDSDRTDTRLFEEGKRKQNSKDYNILFQSYYKKLLQKIDSFPEPNSPINRIRNEMSKQCDVFAEKPSGIYTLSMPTGTGKTLSSLRYALKHALLYQKKHIIYVLPYTTIIEQNANEVRTILQDEQNILEHHSNIVDDRMIDDENQDGVMNIQQKLNLAKENWDSPIIFTTMVQFLNVFYAGGTTSIRRLHNLMESVIIFDEVQKVPTSCISLFNQALNFLCEYGKSSILLCTATQPALGFVEHRLNIRDNSEITENVDEVIEQLKRVNIIDLASDRSFNSEKLAEFIKEKIKEVQNILVILNTKSVVKMLYDLIKGLPDVTVYHLSTSMCAAHRKDILQDIRDKLKSGEKIICVSTQLIEAGVDVSFQCVIRSLAGLDSIAQAAGRCNRHGEQKIQDVYVIDHEEENLSHLKEIQVGKRVAKRIFTDIRLNPSSYGGNILSRAALEKYFKEFYSEVESDLDYFIPKLKINMVELLSAPRKTYQYHKAYVSKYNKTLQLCIVNSYKTAADFFKVIEENTTPVLVPYKRGKEVIAELNGNQTVENLRKLLKSAQQYTINIYDHELLKLKKSHGLVSLLDGNILALKDGAYDDNYGLDIENESNLDFLFH